MGRIAFLFRTDVHMADRNPPWWKGDYAAELWASLEQIGKLAETHRVHAVLDGGDYFHVKSAARNSHAMVARTADVHRAYPCPTWTIEGNHDLVYNDLDSIDRQPLGVLYASGVFKALREEVVESDGLRVRVVGIPYSPKLSLDTVRAVRKQPGDTHLILLLHALAAQKPPASLEEIFNEVVLKYEDLITDDGPDCIAFGHWHRDQGCVQIGRVTFVNPGAVSRGALIKENLDRAPKVVLIEVTELGVQTTELPLQVAPAADMFDLQRKKHHEDVRKDIDNFVEVLRSNASADTSNAIEDQVKSLDFADDVRDLALEYLERASAEAT